MTAKTIPNERTNISLRILPEPCTGADNFLGADPVPLSHVTLACGLDDVSVVRFRNAIKRLSVAVQTNAGIIVHEDAATHPGEVLHVDGLQFRVFFGANSEANRESAAVVSVKADGSVTYSSRAGALVFNNNKESGKDDAGILKVPAGAPPEAVKVFDVLTGLLRNFKHLGLPRPAVDADFIRNIPDYQQFSAWMSKALDDAGRVDVDPAGVPVLVSRHVTSPLAQHAGLAGIMPLMAEIWRAAKTAKYQAGIVWVSCPEAHLHPRWQGGIVGAVNSAFKNRAWNGTRLIFETHSDAIANKMFETIKGGDDEDRGPAPNLEGDDAGLIMFGSEKPRDCDGNKNPNWVPAQRIDTFRFGRRGFGGKTGWPYGFFGY